VRVRRAQAEPFDWRRAYRRRRDAERFDLRDRDLEPKGWKRTRHKISQRDLLVPLSPSRLKLLGACLVCGLGLALLWGFFPLLMVAIMLNEKFGRWHWAGLAGFAAVVTAALFLYASAEEEKEIAALYE
jgi:hypothetical protein